MSLKDLEIREEYRSDRTNLIQDFYLPCLSHTVVYSRAVGFFSSSSIVAVAGGLTGLIKAGGRMRLVASPNLTPEDVEAIATGLKQREEVINRVILQELAIEFEAVAKDRLACLAWLLSQEILEIKLAISKNLTKPGIYHEKLGIFEDKQGNKLAFTGSANETYSALNDNFECIDVFCSWKEEKNRTDRKVEHFENLWNNQTSKVEIINFPEAATRKLLQYRPNRPPTKETEIKLKRKTQAVAEENSSYQAELDKNKFKSAKTLHGLNLELRPYQTEALEKFITAKHRGILAMATGAGKTITALACATSLPDLNVIFIVVPTKELVHQWLEELNKLTNFYSPVAAIGKSEVWKEQLFRKLRLIHLEKQASKRLTILIGIYSELSKLPVAELIEDAGGLPEKSLIIADEVHTAGAEQYRRILREDFTYRLGLSATPIRPHDEEGTEYILDYFDDIVYEFSLEDAIRLGILCQYEYYVYIVSLTEEENEQFKQLTSKIGSLLHSKKDKIQSRIKRLTIQRAKLIKSATNKITVLERIIEDHPLKKGMVYCADLKQADLVCQRLAQQGVSVTRYSSKENKQRPQILDDFAQGYLKGLVAVKCLDEGVNIPAASEAIILASDTTERQFIQRRGRILRAAKGKAIATLIDILVVPPIGDEQVKLIVSEVKRIKHFAKTASNRASVITKLVEELSHYGITYSDLI